MPKKDNARKRASKTGAPTHRLPPGTGEGIRVKSGALKTILFDREIRIRRRFEWAGEVLFEPDTKDGLLRNPFDDPIELDPFGSRPPKPSDDIDLLGDGPIELTPSGPVQPGSDDTEPPPPPVPDENGELEKPIELDLWSHLPPPFPPPFWRPDIDLGGEKPVLDDFFSTYDPCDVFHPLGPFGPFIEPPDTIELIFPRAPFLGPYQAPLERALMEAVQEFLEEIGEAGNNGTIHSDDWEKAGRKAGQKAGKELWKFIRERLEIVFFDGELDFDSACDFARRRPWVTGIGVFLGVAGYGLYLGDQYRQKGKLKIDFGDVEFEWDSETGEWSAGVKVKFKF